MVDEESTPLDSIVERNTESPHQGERGPSVVAWIALGIAAFSLTISGASFYWQYLRDFDQVTLNIIASEPLSEFGSRSIRDGKLRARLVFAVANTGTRPAVVTRMVMISDPPGDMTNFAYSIWGSIERLGSTASPILIEPGDLVVKEVLFKLDLHKGPEPPQKYLELTLYVELLDRDGQLVARRIDGFGFTWRDAVVDGWKRPPETQYVLLPKPSDDDSEVLKFPRLYID